MIKTMIADDNTEMLSMCSKFLTNDKNIEIISTTTDGASTLEDYLKLQPDLLILDLNMPKKSGIEIINELSLNSNERKKCNIIVISGNGCMRYNLLNTEKIYKIIPKPFDYNYLLETIYDYEKSYISSEISEKKIKDLLFNLNILPYSNGAKYIIKAVEIITEKPYLLNNIKNLYLEISSEINIPYSNIKWGIRNSIDTMNRNINTKDFYSIFHINIPVKNITPKIFFTVVNDYFETTYK